MLIKDKYIKINIFSYPENPDVGHSLQKERNNHGVS